MSERATTISASERAATERAMAIRERFGVGAAGAGQADRSSPQIIRAPRGGGRGLAAADGGRLFADWSTSQISGDALFRTYHSTVRDRMRSLEVENEIIESFLGSVEANVVGPHDFHFQMAIMEPGPKGKIVLDEAANDLIEAAWREWGRKENYSTTGLSGRLACNHLRARSMARDGFILVRLVEGFPHNRFRFAVQLIESDYLAIDKCGEAEGTGNPIRLGIEFDRQWGRPVAYHLYGSHPGDFFMGYGTYRGQSDTVRIPADQIIICTLTHRASQVLGWPWPLTAIRNLRQLNAYAEAEVIAARAQAHKIGILYSEANNDGGTLSDSKPDPEAAAQNVVDSSPGEIIGLPYGVNFRDWNPTHPNANFAAFRKAILRGVASGLHVNYNTLTGDLEGVNYTSLRMGALVERDYWKLVQTVCIEDCERIIFERWLRMALVSGAIPLPFSKFDKFNAPIIEGRRWPWVDPLKDVQAKVIELQNLLDSPSGVAADMGRHFPTILRQIKGDKDMIESMLDIYGLMMEKANQGQAANANQGSKPKIAPKDEPEDEDEEGDDDSGSDE